MFLDTRFFLKPWSSFRLFYVLWDETISTENRDIPLLCIEFFDNRNILKHRGVTLRCFPVVWDDRFPKGKRDTPSFSPPLLVFRIFLDTREFLEHRRIPIRSFSLRCDKKFSTGKRDTPLYPPFPLVFEKFRNSKKSQNHKRSPSQKISVLWEKIHLTENDDIPYLISNFSWYAKVSGTLKTSPTKFFGPVREKKKGGKSWQLSLNCNNSRYQNFSETQKNFANKFLR